MYSIKNNLKGAQKHIKIIGLVKATVLQSAYEKRLEKKWFYGWNLTLTWMRICECIECNKCSEA